MKARFNRPVAAALTALTALTACTAAEVRVGEGKIPPITGNQEFSLGMYTCGMPITAQGYTVTTKEVGTDCEFTFDQTVTVIQQSDYQSIPDLQGSTHLVQAIEVTVKTLAFSDAMNGKPLDYNMYVKSVSLKIEGQQVADKSTLMKLPATVRLEGPALERIKVKVDARQPASVKATAVMLVPKDPRPPDRLKVEYNAQPTLVLGTGKVNLGQ